MKKLLYGSILIVTTLVFVLAIVFATNVEAQLGESGYLTPGQTVGGQYGVYSGTVKPAGIYSEYKVTAVWSSSGSGGRVRVVTNLGRRESIRQFNQSQNSAELPGNTYIELYYLGVPAH